MSVQDVLNAITTVGFPIFCCIVMAWYVKYSTDKNKEEVNKLNEQHREEMKEVTTAINNNTLALQKLCDLMKPEDI